MQHDKPWRTTLTAALAGTVALVTACSGPTGTGGSPDLTLQVWGDTRYSTTMVDLYAEVDPEAAGGTTIDVVSAGQGDGESVEALRLALSSGQDVPDIVQLNYSQVAEFAEAGVLADLEEHVAPHAEGLSKAALELSRYEGRTVAIPYEVKSKLWFYRADMFQAAGIDPGSVRTQDDFIAAGEKLRATFPDSSIWNLGPNPQGYAWNMILSGNGARFSTHQPRCEITVASDGGTIEAFRAIRDLRDSGVVETSYDDFSPEWQKALGDGSLASTLSASWLSVFLPTYAPDLAGRWSVTTWPEIGGARGGSESGGSVFVIPEASEHKDEAAHFLATMLLSQEGATAFASEVGYLPNVVAAQDDPAIANDEYFGPSLVEAYRDADEDFTLFPFDPNYAREFSVLQGAMSEYLASPDTDPVPHLTTAQEQLDAQIGCPYDE
ncbi:ABC transporter substrate-binding protein [Kineococcus glutinatus]|uniref:Extracellular solute-binding protein n=1 Tax=Kineococcus glutinatus TaxID=1070872 RepID=A0ABP9HDS1_9ACTN